MSDYKELIKAKFNELRFKKTHSDNKRIRILFDYWLENFLILNEHNNMPPYQCLHLEEWYLKKNIQNKQKKFFLIKRFIKMLLSFLPQNKKLYIYNKRKRLGVLEDIQVLSFSEKLKKLKLNFNKDNKKNFLEDLKKIIPSEIHLNLSKALPDFFFFEELSIDSFPNEIYLAHGHILQYPWNLLALIKNPIRIIGIQHGGNYGEFKKNSYQIFEESYCDEFYFWGLGNKNTQQQRFKEGFNNKLVVKNAYILDFYGSIFARKHIVGFNQINLDLKNFKIYRKLEKEFGQLSHLVHPKEKQADDNSKILLDKMSKEDQRNSIILIPYPGSTVFYKCVYEDIPFVMYLNDVWKKYFTDNYLELLCLLEKEKKLFWWHEEEELAKYLKNLYLSSKPNHKLSNKNIKDYLEKRL